MLSEAYQGEKLVLIENEFGEISIDGGFLKDSGVQISEMSSGCICCSLVGDFNKALRQVHEQFAPDRILIEPSGVGKLSDVIVAVENTVRDEPDMKLNSFVTVADATKVKVYMKNFGEFYNNQIESAGTIILSRTQKLSQEKLEAAVALLREKNPTAAILTTPWDQLDGKTLLSAVEKVSLADELLAVSHRPYGTGFYYGDARQSPDVDGYTAECRHAATVEACEPAGEGAFRVIARCYNRFCEGDELEALSPGPHVPLVRVRNLAGSRARRGRRAAKAGAGCRGEPLGRALCVRNGGGAGSRRLSAHAYQR